MISIAGPAAEILSKPGPVLCLDTCDFLDVLRGLRNKSQATCRAFVRLRDKLNLNPGRLRVVTTYLVRHEWNQNLNAVRAETLNSFEEISERLALVDEARSLIGLKPLYSSDLDKVKTLDGLVRLAQEVIDQAAVLEQDQASVDLALGRVMARRRPSHKNQIKDSIHLEHYLALARQLRASGFGEPCLFVSGNKADFWAEGGVPRVHPNLEADLQAAGLTFYARLEDAVRRLGI